MGQRPHVSQRFSLTGLGWPPGDLALELQAGRALSMPTSPLDCSPRHPLPSLPCLPSFLFLPVARMGLRLQVPEREDLVMVIQHAKPRALVPPSVSSWYRKEPR